MDFLDEIMDEEEGSDGSQSDEEQEGWDDLLESVDFDESLEEETGDQGFFAKLLGRFQKRETPPDTGDEQGSESDETSKESTSKKARSKSGGFTRNQKLVLGVLGLMVLLVYVALIVVVVRTMRNSASVTPEGKDQPLEVISADTTPIEWTGDSEQLSSTESITETGEPEGAETPSDPFEPTLTPTPAAPFTQYDSQISKDPNNVDLRLKRGAEYMQLGDYTAAARDFEYAVSVQKENAEGYAGLGNAYFALYRWDEAEKAYGSAISFNAELPMAHFALAKLHYYRANYTEAAREFDWAAEINPGFVEAECWLAIASARAGDKQEAVAAAGRAYSLTQELTLVYVARSWALRVQDPPDLDGAQGDLLYAQELDPYGFEVQNELAHFYADYRPERIGEAEQLAQYAVNWAKTDFERALGLHTLGRVYLAQDRKADAQKVLGEAADYSMADGRISMLELQKDLDRAYSP